ncbi:hypothetical protein MmiHf6_10280 [Methanimicrococcus hongohii]|uniref:DUF5640 domain-containing protein n=1 Tax=Methanimicrococcus hongohii TaxID=3028295 RepID=A0AA96UZX4_9EURY|nr:hypothetical protein [Methanimicrococcus sp. Hf6]WNY23714.1 hypothetical protein MmiHf6_10280 [Methanimicrococcus sp. Hf6]
MFSGCLGNSITGTWKSDDSSATITINKDGTYVASMGVVELKGDWVEDGDNYAFYFQGAKIGSAAFEDKKLRVTLGSGLLNISGTFTKQ